MSPVQRSPSIQSSGGAGGNKALRGMLRFTLVALSFTATIFVDHQSVSVALGSSNQAERMVELELVLNNVTTDVATTIVEGDGTECGNSKEWLQGPRHGNLWHDPLFTADLAKTLILNIQNLLISEQRHAVLGRTICHADGPFRDDGAMGVDSEDGKTVQLWAVRLIYYALHYHQHRMAIPEATKRYNENQDNNPCSPRNMSQRFNVNAFDYECPDTKYVIAALGGNGLGANVRGGMNPAYLLGLTTDRVVLFVNNVKGRNKPVSRTWALASCPQRRDYQCFFQPTTPCTLTVDDINNAYPLSDIEVENVTRSLQIPAAEQHKVWTYKIPFDPGLEVRDRVVEKVREYARLLIQGVPDRPENAGFIALLNKAVDSISDVRNVDVDNKSREGRRRDNYFGHRFNKIYHALTIYSMRPSPSSLAELDDIMRKIIPESLNPETTLGLPVRGAFV